MTFTKKKLAAVISGSLLMGLAATASATVNLDQNIDTNDANDTDVSVASEISIDPLGTAIDDSTTATFLDVVAVANPAIIPANSDIRVTVTLGGTATFSSNVPTAQVGAIAMGVIAGGTGENSVTYNANVGTNDLPATQNLTLEIPEITVTDQSDVTMTVEVNRADNFGTAAVKTITAAPYLNFADSYAVTYTPTGDTVSQIDVTNNSVVFTAGDTANTATLDAGDVDVAFTAQRDTAGGTIVQTAISDAFTVTVSGSNGLDAFASSNTGASIAVGAAGTTLTGTDAVTGTLDAATLTSTHQVLFTVPATNAISIQETPVMAAIAGTANTGYNLNSVTGMGSLSGLEKNGSSARLTFALTPGGAYPQYIRMTNPSNVAGNISLTLTNDDGLTSLPIDIGDIDGQAGNDLAAGASTPLLTIDNVMAAVQAVDSAFDLGTDSDKLRVDITAEFGDSGQDTSVILQAFSLSADGNSFNMMTDASN